MDKFKTYFDGPANVFNFINEKRQSKSDETNNELSRERLTLSDRFKALKSNKTAPMPHETDSKDQNSIPKRTQPRAKRTGTPTIPQKKPIEEPVDKRSVPAAPTFDYEGISSSDSDDDILPIDQIVQNANGK